MKSSVLILIILNLFISCANKSDKIKTNTEGTITYSITYETSENTNSIVTLLPNQLKYQFKNNDISLLAEGYLGFFSTKFISKIKDPTSSILFKILDKKMNYEFCNNKIPFIYNHKLATNIEYIETNKIIAGYKCKLARVYIKNISKPIDIYYTTDIYLKNPNRNTPFRKIDGVLLEFETTTNGINAKFSAINVNLSPVSQNEFIIPSDYVKTDAKTILKYVLSFN